MISFDDPTWWRHAVVYQVYPRSFADANGDGIGDVRGIIEKLPHLASLQVDAIWVSPWYPSPLHDGGYDVSDYCDIHPDFGTLADADRLIEAAHAQGIRVLIDLVPNHSSNEHPWFQAALAAAPGSRERARYVFRDGLGENGDQPPTNWGSLFGGSAWQRVTEADGTPGQWYLHMFAPEQPDWNWQNPEVVEEFDRVLRFWFDRGIDGFRIDVGDSMFINASWADTPIDPVTGLGTYEKFDGHPLWDQPELEGLQKRWRAIADEYADTPLGARVFVSEAYLPLERLVRYVRRNRLHTSFNFEFLQSEWNAESLRHVVDASLAAHGAVGAPTTWVLNNHDVIRVVSRYGKPITGRRFRALGDDETDDPHWQERMAEAVTDVAAGRRRAAASAMLMFALPGGAYLYEGEELGLEEVEDLPDDVLQDPIWSRSNHTIRGRDGCRVPMPWSGDKPPFGFGGPDADPWLPQPERWAGQTVAAQDLDPDSMLNLYRHVLALRHSLPALGGGRALAAAAATTAGTDAEASAGTSGTVAGADAPTALAWDDSPAGILSFTRDPGFRCVVNLSSEPFQLPAGEVLASSQRVTDGLLPVDAAAWLTA